MIGTFIHLRPVRSMRPVAELSVAAPRAPQALSEVVFVVPARPMPAVPERGASAQGR